QRPQEPQLFPYTTLFRSGTSASIVQRAIEQLEKEFGARAENLRAAIGPAANVCCYEVGAEVIDRFKERFPEADSLFVPTREGHADRKSTRLNSSHQIISY